MSIPGAHILVYPLPAPGHIIPLLDLTHLFLTRGLTVTVVVTPTHLPLLEPLLATHSSVHPLLLSPTPPSDAPPSQQRLSFMAKMRAMIDLSNPILQWFRSHPSPPVAIIYDFFLGWTHQLASQLNVPRVVFFPSGAFASSVFSCVWRDLPKKDDDFLISFPDIPNSPKYPLWQLTRLSRHFQEGDPDWESFRNGMLTNMASWGVVFNSFTELERVYLDYVKSKTGHGRVWAVGPLLPSAADDGSVEPTKRGGSSVVPPHELMTWLDGKADDSVVYVCFGSRTVLTNKQMDALAAALECSKVHFIWCMKAVDQGHVASDSGMIPDGFEDRVGGRGLMIRGWAPQVAILRHRGVGAFVTHCGWNSVLEGIAAGVMMLTWPMRADQFSNAKLLVEQLGIAVRACEGGAQAVPNSVDLAYVLTESVSGTRAERARVKELREAASEAVNGGSSNEDLNLLVKQLQELSSKREDKFFG